MTSLTLRATAYLLIGGGTLIAAVVFRDAPVAAFGLPALIVLAVGSSLDVATVSGPVDVRVRTDGTLVRTGDVVDITVVLRAERPVARFTAFLRVDPPLECRGKSYWTGQLRAGEDVELTVPVAMPIPGGHDLGQLTVTLTGRNGLVERHIVVESPLRLDVLALEQRLRFLPRSRRVRVPTGERLARSVGDGIELGEVRPQLPGESARRINWRATARTGTVHVTLRHPEQSTDVALFVDTFEGDLLPRVLAVASTAAAGYLSRRDRVGLVCFGGVLDWVEAGSGSRQLERIRLRLGTTTPFFSYAWKTLERVPSRAVPAGALVVAVSPLRDERFTTALADLRSRGHEVIVIEIAEPEPSFGPEERPSREAAILLSRMEREDLRYRLFARGVAVVPLYSDDSVDGVFAALTKVRRYMRPGLGRVS